MEVRIEQEPRSERIGISVTATTKKALIERSKKLGMPVSILINAIIQDYLNGEARIIPTNAK